MLRSSNEEIPGISYFPSCLGSTPAYAPSSNGSTRYATGEANDTPGNPKGNGDVHGLSGVYAGGPLTVQGYYQTLEFDDGSGVDTINTDQYGIGAQYRFGAFRIALNHGVADEELPAGGSIEHEAIDIGLGAKLGHGEVLFNYVRQEFDSPRFGVGGGVADTEPQTFAVGIRQRF